VITTLLVDLDGTLLDNDIEQFIPVYFARLEAHIADTAPPDEFTRALIRASRIMMDNRQADRTLKQTFEEHFFPSIKASEADLRAAFESFYLHAFPKLQSLTKPRPAAKRLIDAAFQRGLEVIIATNPVFPLTAITQRLAWAELPAEAHPFTLITSYETFRFCKPDPAYYAEILGRLGRRPQEAAMVGDDHHADIVPANLMGLATFHLDSQTEDGLPGGKLEDVLPWLDELAATLTEPPAPHDPPAIKARLRGNLAALLALTEELEPAAWSRKPAPGEWSLTEILCHLRDVEIEVHQPRLQEIIAKDRPFLPAADPDQWSAERDYQSQSHSEALAAFVQARKRTLSQLEGLPPEAWSRQARHALLGTLTLEEIIGVVADHDTLHLAQLRGNLQAIEPSASESA
jgi:HAD superfamily hydrolase (TIGR01509 family)